MVGLVVVSHSCALARAAIALAREMVADQPLRIEVAAGLDEETFGTDAVAVADAMAAADDGDGVVVLSDLGSAVLSAQLALDLLEDDDLRDRVVLSAGPLVEGLVVAAVTAASGAPRERVAAETAAALLAKQSQLGTDDPAAAPDPQAPVRHTVSATFTAPPPHGLHARPAAALLQVAGETGVDVQLRNLSTGVGPVPANSLTRVATLAARAGDVVEVSASGEGAQEAVGRLLALAENGFVRPDRAAPQRPASSSLGGPDPVPVAPGVAVGPALVRLRERPPVLAGVDRRTAAEALEQAAHRVAAELEALADRVEPRLGADAAAILRAVAALATDSALLQPALDAVDPASAYAGAVTTAAARLGAVDDPYLQARADDVRDVGDAVLHAVTDPSEVVRTLQVPAGSRVVLVADELSAADVAALDPASVAAVVLAGGRASGHPAILARALGLPAVVQAGEGVLAVADGTTIAVDGERGELVVDPSPAVVAAMTGRHPRTRVE